jgi:hypothetical protein
VVFVANVIKMQQGIKIEVTAVVKKFFMLQNGVVFFLVYGCVGI